jgi:hypothetical protein
MVALEFEVLDLEVVRRLRDAVEVTGLDDVLTLRMHLLGPDNPVEFGSFHAFA